MSSILLKQINDYKVKTIKLPQNDLKIKGADLIRELYANIFLCAKKKSGKTIVLFNILKKCIGTMTKKVFIFCNTIYKDQAWKEIRNWFDNREIKYEFFTSIYEDGEDQLKHVIEAINNESKQEEEVKEDTNVMNVDKILARLGGMKKEIKDIERKRKPKYLSPEYFFIFDDLSDELKNPSLNVLLTRNRHYKCKCLLSSQYLNHLLPASRKQIDVWIIFKGHPIKKQEEIHKDADISLPFSTFHQLYMYSTSEPFSFLYIDTRNDDYRMNFNKRFIINEQ